MGEKPAYEGLRVVIAGMPLVMRYTLNSLCELESRAGMPLRRLAYRQYTATRLLLWAGLTECQHDMSLWDVGELINQSLSQGRTLEQIVDLCIKGLRDAGLFEPDDTAEAAN